MQVSYLKMKEIYICFIEDPNEKTIQYCKAELIGAGAYGRVY